MNTETETVDRVETIVDLPSDDPKDILRHAREMIPVGRTGAAPINMAQQLDFARDMAKAVVSIPEHLQKQVGDCLAVVDIATRAGLSPYMVANKNYVQNKRLCFEGQFYHAFAQASGLLKGDLMVEWEGDGDDLVCIISRYLRGDPQLKIHRSPKLNELHPGYTLKRAVDDDRGGTAKKRYSYVDGQKLIAEKKIGDNDQLFSAGSPLWMRKPRVQMFYDTSRDWVRIYAPRATLGIYTPDEIEEYGPDFARDVSPSLQAKLAASKRSDEGHKNGHAERELDQIAAAGQIIEHDAPTGPESNTGQASASGTAAGVGRATGKPNKRTTDAPSGKAKRTKGEKPSEKADPPAEIDKSAAAKLSATIDAEIKAIKTAPQYLKYARKWITACTDSTELFVRWTAERKLRNVLGVTAEDRAPLDELIVEIRAQLED